MAKGQRFQRMPESREASIWDVFKGDYPALTAWSAPTYQYWYPYPFGDPYAKTPGLSPMEKLGDPNAKAAAPEVPAFTPPARGGGQGLALGGSEVGQPTMTAGNAALGLLGGAALGSAAQEGVEKVLGPSTPSTPTPSPVIGEPGSAPAPSSTSQGANLGAQAARAAAQSAGGLFSSLPQFSPTPPSLASPPLNLGMEIGGDLAPGVVNTSFNEPSHAVMQAVNERFSPEETATRATQEFLKGTSGAAPTIGIGALQGTTDTEFLSATPSLGESGAALFNNIGLSGVGDLLPILGSIAKVATMPKDQQGLATALLGPNTRGSNPIMPVLSGALAGLSFGPIGAAVGAAAGLIHSLTGGGKSLAQRQADEKMQQAHDTRGVLTGLNDVLLPNTGLDLPGIDSQSGDLSTLDSNALKASLDRANQVLWQPETATAGDWGSKGQANSAKNQMEFALYNRMLAVQDELTKRGVKTDPIIYGPDYLRGATAPPPVWNSSLGQYEYWNADPNTQTSGSLDPQERLFGGTNRDWTLAQMASRAPTASGTPLNAESALLWLLSQQGATPPAVGQESALLKGLLAANPEAPAGTWEHLKAGEPVGPVPSWFDLSRVSRAPQYRPRPVVDPSTLIGGA